MKTFSDYIQEFREEKESAIVESAKFGKDGKYIPIEIGKDGKYHPEDRLELNILLYQEKIDASLIDVTKITDFNNIFSHIDFSRFPQLKGISKWDVSKVKKMYFAFDHAKNIPDLSKWDTRSAENMEGMFTGSDFNGDVSKWNVSKVDNFYGMFSHSKFNGDISKWKIGKDAHIGAMFNECPLQQKPTDGMHLRVLLLEDGIDPRMIDISKITDFSGLFSGVDFNRYPKLKEISNWDVSHAKDMSHMFEGAKNIPDLSKWDTRNVKDMSCMFYNSSASANDCGISGWNVSRVERMSLMFAGAKNISNLSDWKPSNVKDMRFMFCKSNFNGDISRWKYNMKKDAITLRMFLKCPLEKNPPSWYTEE